MKKALITIMLILIGLFSSFTYSTVNAKDGFDIAIPEKLDISENETEFKIVFNSDIEKDTSVKVNYSTEIKLENKTGDLFPAAVKSSRNSFSKKGDEIVFTITHDDIPEGNWNFDLDITFTIIKNQTPVKNGNETIKKQTTEESNETIEHEDTVITERKTMYTWKDIYDWDKENYSLEATANSKSVTQYSYETAEFDNSNFAYEIPSDGIYLEKTLYGYKERKKTKVETPYTYVDSRRYNNIGSCPMDCISGTINDYGTGCECTISEYKEDIKISYNYGEWKENENSYRFDGPYKESDTVASLEKTVYLLPVSYTQSDIWTFDEITPSNTSRVLTRTVYVSPLSTSDESAPSDTRPEENENRIIASYEYCRIVTNGKAGEWKPCS